MAKYYPVFLNLQGKKCVVVGGGNIAWRKACSLKDAGAQVTVVSPAFCTKLKEDMSVERIQQEYDQTCLEGAFVVIASTDNEEMDKQIYYDAVGKGLLVNVVDKPEFCTFIVPASVMRGDLCISISTGGASPALAKNIRELLENQFGDEYDSFVGLLSEMRKKILSEVPGEAVRREILQRIAGFDLLDIAKKTGIAEAKRKMLEIASGVTNSVR
ncbi:MAG: bifunctional precorrin-2 dehydrogenase/sirohydrochlorin ferrochelatase [Planctomycetes bacterium]|nr:bifunctional precorrin-2 dehydrogenase/sirohydrochlorin ferrochelatase [Planctomycetota bacterium]